MQKINLRKLYPDVYKTDVFVDVAEEVLAAIRGQEQRHREGGAATCPHPGGTAGGKAATGTAVCSGDGTAGEAGQADLREVLPGHDCDGNCAR